MATKLKLADAHDRRFAQDGYRAPPLRVFQPEPVFASSAVAAQLVGTTVVNTVRWASSDRHRRDAGAVN
jgi:hypothetical protein